MKFHHISTNKLQSFWVTSILIVGFLQVTCMMKTGVMKLKCNHLTCLHINILWQLWNKASQSSALSTPITLQISEIDHTLIQCSLLKKTLFNMSPSLCASPWYTLMPYRTLFLMGDILSINLELHLPFTITIMKIHCMGIPISEKNSISSPEKKMPRNLIILNVKHLPTHTHKY